MNISRRGFLGGLLALAAPAVITTPGLLMPLRGQVVPYRTAIWLPLDCGAFRYNGLVSYLSDFSDLGEPYLSQVKAQLALQSRRSTIFERRGNA